MSIISINEASYRPIESGLKFDVLLPKTNCMASYLGKDDTYFTLNQMKVWANKYQSQTKKLSQVLKAYNLETTANNIYQFLYNNLQYKQDGFTQNIKSPSCAWQTRTDGIDCKSYSIFASTILLNLGIHHYFRMIKQSGLNPTEFSHVYIVIPLDQNTKNKKTSIIIDATVHKNKEVPYLEKYDKLMNAKLPHYGLNGTIPKGFKTTTDPMEIGIINFKMFLAELSNLGASQAIINELQNFVRIRLESGNDPKFKVKRGVLYVDEKPFDLKITQSGLNYGLNADDNADDTSSDDSSNSGWFKAIIGAIVTAVDWDKFFGNFGAIFSNGFDLHCWGSSWNPEKGKEFAKGIYETYNPLYISLMQERTTVLVKAQKFNQFLYQFEQEYVKQETWYLNDAKDCTKAGLKVIVTTLNEARDLYKQGFERLLSENNLGFTTSNVTLEAKKGTKQVPQYTVTGNITDDIINVDTGNNDNNNTDNTDTGNDDTSSSSFGKILGYGSVAAAAAFLIIPSFKDQKKSPVKKNNVKQK